MMPALRPPFVARSQGTPPRGGSFSLGVKDCAFVSGALMPDTR